MGSRLETLKQDFEQLFRQHKRYILVDQVDLFVSGCGCKGLCIRPGGLRTGSLDAEGEGATELLIATCSQYGIDPDLGYVQMVFGSRDLVERLFMVAACQACRSNVLESGDLAPAMVFYDGAGRRDET
jgi:hypothetical protein